MNFAATTVNILVTCYQSEFIQFKIRALTMEFDTVTLILSSE